MDTYRGLPGDRHEAEEAYRDALAGDEDGAIESPAGIGQDERRMQVRAYNHWAALLDDRHFPSVEDLDPAALPDFGPYSVLLDFTAGIDNPAVQYLCAKLAVECGADSSIRHLGDVPSRSLLSRITDHYMQILANQAPIGFEAEFVNQRGQTILYRGILLPFSSDDDTIDFIYGVINWKELADQQTTDELMLEIDQALDAASEPVARREDPLTVWADGPASSAAERPVQQRPDEADVLDLATLTSAGEGDPIEWPEPAFGAGQAPVEFAAAALAHSTDATPGEIDPASMGLGDWLASARELAQVARTSEDRTRGALYAAIGRAYDFALAASGAPDEFADLLAESGVTAQERAPMTPVVKLVFGADYDKTRLTEYAAALNHAQRLGLPGGALGTHLAEAPGGLKGVVHAERLLRKAESGKAVAPREGPSEAIARRLRELAPASFAALASDGAEFALLVARRLPGGEVVLLGEVPDDVALLERAARKLLD